MRYLLRMRAYNVIPALDKGERGKKIIDFGVGQFKMVEQSNGEKRALKKASSKLSCAVKAL